MTLSPTLDQILVRVLHNPQEEQQTASGLFVPNTAAVSYQRGEVLAVGPGPRGGEAVCACGGRWSEHAGEERNCPAPYEDDNFHACGATVHGYGGMDPRIKPGAVVRWREKTGVSFRGEKVGAASILRTPAPGREAHGTNSDPAGELKIVREESLLAIEGPG